MKQTFLSLALLLAATTLQAQPRQETELSDDWQFSRDRESWQTVSVPHDWAIGGPFDKQWDLQVVRIEQNGEREATEKSGRSGALPWIGEGHYRRTFTIPQGFSGHAELVFDGAMAEPVVSVNGQRAGYWPYGYNSFSVDATPYIKAGENLLEVDLNNLEESSRWYPGAGIYRPVKLVLTGRNFLHPWRTFVYTKQIGQDQATLAVELTTELPSQGDLAVEVELRDAQGQVVDQQHVAVTDREARAQLTVDQPRLWTPETPYLYNARIRLMQNGRTIDEIMQRVGVRTVRVSREGGFQLNGQTRKLRGVCLHHDLGPLGAAVSKAALIRQIKTMKAMGCDAIRTAHNMPSQWQMELCDSLGMMVMAESFDMWVYPKCKNGYARFFREWSDRDVEQLVRAHRNHPSIVMWSIGNEIPEQGMQGGTDMARRLQDICHRFDPTRPVTQGMDRAESALKTGFAQVMDVPGFNYRVHKYKKNIGQLPQGFLLGSETASTVSSRGVYQFPVVAEAADDAKSNLHRLHYNGQCSGYDVQYCSWSNLPDDDWRWQDDYPWVIGEFVWTGYDYLGEPSPYDEYWPSRSSYFGICDLAGLPKDRYFLYRSHWNTSEHTIHLLPHWSWGTAKRQKGNRIGQVTPVYCYTDYPEAELFVNGKSQGRVKKKSDESSTENNDNRLDRYRLRWNDVLYEPGELRVVVYDAEGRTAGEQTLRTAGEPAALHADVWTQDDRGTLRADGLDLAFVTVSLTDADGTLVPDATDRLRFEVEGAGTFRAVCNGDATSLEPFTQPTMQLFSGQLVVVVQAARQPGALTLNIVDEQRGLTLKRVIEVR